LALTSKIECPIVGEEKLLHGFETGGAPGCPIKSEHATPWEGLLPRKERIGKSVYWKSRKGGNRRLRVTISLRTVEIRMSHGGLKRARSRKRRIQPNAYSPPGLLDSRDAVRLISKIADAYKLDTAVRRTFRATALRLMTSTSSPTTCLRPRRSLGSLPGRPGIPFVCDERRRQNAAHVTTSQPDNAGKPLLSLRRQHAGWMRLSARLPNVQFAFFSRLGATSGATNAQSFVLRGFHDGMMQDFAGPN
jgi:hypothetical protein